jgi:hypothetical protein
MATGHCPKCDAKAVVAGRFPDLRGRGRQWFEPAGMRFFYFRLWGPGVDCPEPFRACLRCGLVWTHLQPEDLRTFIDKHGNAEARRQLSAFQKGPPEQDLD